MRESVVGTSWDVPSNEAKLSLVNSGPSPVSSVPSNNSTLKPGQTMLERKVVQTVVPFADCLTFTFVFAWSFELPIVTSGPNGRISTLCNVGDQRDARTFCSSLQFLSERGFQTQNRWGRFEVRYTLLFFFFETASSSCISQS